MRKDWIEVELGLVCDFKGGGTPSKSVSSYWNGDIPWASIKDIKGSYLTQTEDFITEEGLNNSASNLAFENEIILATRINPGRPIISKIKTAVNQDLKIVKPLITFSNKFLFYIFKKIEPEVIKASSGTTVLGINLTNLREIQVPVPPLPEQRAIVSKIEELFSELDHSIASFKAAKAKLEIYRQAVLKKAFEGGYTNSNPLNWKVAKLKEYSEKVVVGYVGPITDYFVNEGGVPLLSTTHIGENQFKKKDIRLVSTDFDKKNKKSNVKPGDLIIARHGDSGKACIIPDYIKSAQVSNAVIFSPDLKKIVPEFICYRLNFERTLIQKFKVGGVLQVVNTKTMENFKFAIPSLSEQTQIVQEIESHLSVADKLAETIEINLKKSEALRQSILKKAFEGKLLSEAELEACRKEADWEPAEKLLERVKSEKKKVINKS